VQKEKGKFTPAVCQIYRQDISAYVLALSIPPGYVPASALPPGYIAVAAAPSYVLPGYVHLPYVQK